MSAFIGIKLCAGRHKSRIPDGSVIVNIVIFSVGIVWDIIVAVAGDAEQLGIFIEAVASAGVGDQAEKILGSKIVDPWQWGAWSGDDVLAGFIVEMSEFHINPPLKMNYRLLLIWENEKQENYATKTYKFRILAD